MVNHLMRYIMSHYNDFFHENNNFYLFWWNFCHPNLKFVTSICHLQHLSTKSMGSQSQIPYPNFGVRVRWSLFKVSLSLKSKIIIYKKFAHYGAYNYLNLFEPNLSIFLGLVEQVWRLKRLKALRIVWSGNLPKLYFWQKLCSS